MDIQPTTALGTIGVNSKHALIKQALTLLMGVGLGFVLATGIPHSWRAQLANTTMIVATPAEAPYDAHFLDILLEDHRSALEMAEPHRGGATQIQKFASVVYQEQYDELNKMTVWRKLWYPGVAHLAPEKMEKKLGPKVVPESMETAPERLFLQTMILHHQAELELAKEAAQRAEHKELRKWAADVQPTLTREIDSMKDLLKG